MTVGELLEVLAADPDRAWIELARQAVEACPTSRRGCDRDDLIQESCLRALQDNAAALRRAQPGTPLRPWLRNVVKRITRENSRRNPVPSARDGGDGTSGDRSSPVVALGDVDFRLLTNRQAQALSLLAAGCPIAEIARKLKIRWQSARDLLGRAMRAGTRGKRQAWAGSRPQVGAPPPDDRQDDDREPGSARDVCLRVDPSGNRRLAGTLPGGRPLSSATASCGALNRLAQQQLPCHGGDAHE